MKSILGIGNALVDILVRLESDELLKRYRLPKGGMHHVDSDLSDRLWNEVQSRTARVVAGGSASNTLTGASDLGMSGAFIGKIGSDQLGKLFAGDQLSHGLTPHLLRSLQPTGRCIVFITPDAERTMATYLGAAIDLASADLWPYMFEGYTYFHIEGYLVQNYALLQRAVELAKAQQLIISLDLASYNVVEENRQFLSDIIENYVDIVFANEAEAMAFTGGYPPLEALRELSKQCRIAVVKTGSSGSFVRSGSEEHKISACPAKAIDDTGAGDMYAAGFLFAHSCGFPLQRCGNIASLVAAKVVESIGPRIEASAWNSLRKDLAALYY
jgi:sugar/nucleoside kinase (ribokinase family)